MSERRVAKPSAKIVAAKALVGGAAPTLSLLGMLTGLSERTLRRHKLDASPQPTAAGGVDGLRERLGALVARAIDLLDTVTADDQRTDGQSGPDEPLAGLERVAKILRAIDKIKDAIRLAEGTASQSPRKDATDLEQAFVLIDRRIEALAKRQAEALGKENTDGEPGAIARR